MGIVKVLFGSLGWVAHDFKGCDFLTKWQQVSSHMDPKWWEVKVSKQCYITVAFSAVGILGMNPSNLSCI